MSEIDMPEIKRLIRNKVYPHDIHGYEWDEQPSLSAWRDVVAYVMVDNAVDLCTQAKEVIPGYLEVDKQWKEARKETPKDSAKCDYYWIERKAVTKKFWDFLEGGLYVQKDLDVEVHGIEPIHTDEDKKGKGQKR